MWRGRSEYAWNSTVGGEKKDKDCKISIEGGFFEGLISSTSIGNHDDKSRSPFYCDFLLVLVVTLLLTAKDNKNSSIKTTQSA